MKYCPKCQGDIEWRAGSTNHKCRCDDAKESPSSGSERRLVRLLARFRRFASSRREVADRWSKKGLPRTAEEMRNAAKNYDRCADELERVINGEIPADPGCDWPICETNVESSYA